MAENSKNPGLLLRNAGIFNPVLVQAVGLCPVVAMATTIKGAALLSIVAAIAITLSEVIASAFLKVIPRWIRTGIYIIIGCALVVPIMYLIEKVNPELFGTLGIYLPVMAVNSLLVLRCERFTVRIKPLAALADGAAASAGYAAVLLLVGAIREIIGSGTIAGFKFWEGRTLTGLLLPFGGFLMIGFAGAALRSLISAYWPKYLDKKQPKPRHGKKIHAPNPEPKVSIVAILPDLAPEETDISFDDIPAEIQPEAEPEAEEAVTEEAPVAADEEATEAVEVEEKTETENEPEENPEPEKHTQYEELKIEDVAVETKPEATNEKHYSFDDVADDELEKLMSRSMDDVFGHKEGKE
ncbi:MAG: hypothetical protein IKL41_01170 [Clostridia bacterium]|nr:hypothetical protein [Clostridia bacterium]